MIDDAMALQHLLPGVEFSCGETYESIIIHTEGVDKPSDDELQTAYNNWLVVKTIADVTAAINHMRKTLLATGVIFDGHRYGIDQMAFVSNQMSLLMAGFPSSYGDSLWDSENQPHPMKIRLSSSLIRLL